MICRAIPFEGSEPYLFVSYCHKDQEQLYPLLEQMVLDGYRVWYDDGNHGGDDWLENIENHLEDSSAVVAFISDNSSLSHNCKCEIVYALKCKKKVIPILIDEADLPKGLRMQLSHLHHLKRSDYSSDKALLAKIYEAEECAACKTTPGTLKLREAAQVRQAVAESKPEDDFWEKYNRVDLSAAKTEEPPAKPEISEALTPAPMPKTNRVIVTVKRPRSTPAAKPAEVLVKPEAAEEKQEPPVRVADAPVMETLKTELVDIPKDEKEEPAEIKTELVNVNFDDGPATVVLSNNSMQALLLQPSQQRAYILRKPQTKIGRSPIKCDVAIEGNESISKTHAEIIQYNEKYFLRDDNSTNGTYANGARIDADCQVELDNPAVFHLNDECLILLTGVLARKYIGKKRIAFLIRDEGNSIRIIDTDRVLLNRGNPWQDGTFEQDYKVHRAAHALLKMEEDGLHLVDESPEQGNGTYLNDSRMPHGGSCLLSSGDRIRLGNTTLKYFSITI